nr:hypothetical protein CFP56_44017 [Quercus suber]
MRLFMMDEEDKINLKVETPSATSRIQLRFKLQSKPIGEETWQLALCIPLQMRKTKGKNLWIFASRSTPPLSHIPF